MIHQDSTINSFVFSKDFSIIATAAGDGCKIVDPVTLEIMRYFKNDLPMNCVGISPLFCSEVKPRYHVIMAGGIPAIYAATKRGAGF